MEAFFVIYCTYTALEGNEMKDETPLEWQVPHPRVKSSGLNG